MARPKKQASEKKGHPVSFRVSSTELAALNDRIKRSGLGSSAFLRQQALNGRVIIKTGAAPDFALIAELNKIGVNLNQLTRTANATGRISPEIERLCSTIEQIVMKAIDLDS